MLPFVFLSSVLLGVRMQGAPADLPSLLIYLAGGGAVIVASWFVSRVLEGSGWFEPLSPDGKLLAVGALTVMISIAATAAQQFLAANVGVSAELNPYVTAALLALSFVTTQVAHGRSKANGSAPRG
jgi:hypothetical protein